MNRTAFKLAASTVMVAMTMTSVAAPSGAVRRNGTVRADGPGDREARQLFDQAGRALQQGDLAQATTLLERAVAASPRDVGYRMLLADAYLRSGRFTSARATYAEAVELDPSNNRAALSVALIHIAQGRPAAAVGILDNIAGRAPAADVGLAYALAGRAERAVELLDSAARSPMATPRTRQNLALAHAFAGDWNRARAIASQDIPPSEVEGRMAQWAQMVRPGSGPTQVATLLGVSPGADRGRPVQVALGETEPVVPGENAVQVAQVSTPSRANFAPAEPLAPVEGVVAAAERPAEAPAFWAPAESYQAEALAEAPEALAPAPAPRVVRLRPHAVAVRSRAPVEQLADDAELAVAAAAETRTPAFQPAPAPAPTLATPRVPVASAQPPRARRAAYIRAAAVSALPRSSFRIGADVRTGNAPVVVQLGAFRSDASAERGWQQVSARYGLEHRRPLTTTFSHRGQTLHRVSISGFATTLDAQRLCGQIRSHGGVCFVRATAGDASIRWAARYSDPRRRDA
ncbi:MAG TPA: tetratricopeptide repeat protein [Allosphingosinicella sp.]|nr:tetratricopeptide repeat protein [Allosphingosinicella sp.]